MAWLHDLGRSAREGWALSAVVVTALCWFASPSGCATGSSSTDDDDSIHTTPTGAGGATGGNTSTGGGTGLSGGSTTSTSTSTGGDGGHGGWPCDEDPCKLTEPQCGCPPGEKCDFSSTGRQCETDGTVGGGEACTGNNCLAGHICLQYVGPPSICYEFCNDDSDCVAPGGQCVLTVESGSYSESVCSFNCDPITSVGCSVAGMKCDIGILTGPPEEIFTMCVPSGAGTHGSACADIVDCGPGYSCFTLDSVEQCLQWCNMAAPSCSTVGTICNGLTTPIIVGSIEYGVCVPY